MRNGGSEELPRETHVYLDLVPGERLFHSIGGSGGYGPSLERDVDAVMRDIRAGKLSAARARAVYGVVIDPSRQAASLPATDECRGARQT
jgi:N-methylhydantoinase B